MKNTNIIAVLIIIILIIALTIGGYFIIKSSKKVANQAKNFTINTNENEETSADKTSNKKTAVVYFSATGNTKQVAEYIKDETNSDIFEIVPKQKYTSEDLNIKTEAGDIVLYQGNQISLFYNSNSWSYTKLGKIKDITEDELKNILGSGDVKITLMISR